MAITRNLLTGSHENITHNYGTVVQGEDIYSVAVDGTTGEPQHTTGTVLATKLEKTVDSNFVVTRNHTGRVARLWVNTKAAANAKNILLTVVIMEGSNLRGYIAKDLLITPGISINLVDKEQPVHLYSENEMKIYAHAKYEDGTTISNTDLVIFGSCITETLQNDL